MSESDVTPVPAEGRPAPTPPATRVVLPDVEREYHQFYRTPYFRWWRPLLALVMVFVTCFVASGVIPLGGLAVTGELDLEELSQGRLDMNTPTMFLLNNLGIIAFIPLAWAAHRAVFGQRIGWLSSVAGRFRWHAFWRFVGLSAAILVVMFAIRIVAEGGLPELKILPETWFLLAAVLLTTPLQCAGEEFAFRGLGMRAIASWFPSSRVGLIVAAVVTTGVFMLFHGAGDAWLNADYAVFGLCTAVLVWRTGGLEGAIALHIANNFLALILLPFIGTSGLFDRQAGVGSPWQLLNMAALVGATALILWQAKRLGLQSRSAPAAPTAAVTGDVAPA